MSPAATPEPTPTLSPTPTPTPEPAVDVDLDGTPGRLGSVIDGDTFTVATRSGEFTIRILGIDAPEFDDVGQRELAKQAREALRSLIGSGPVRLVADVESKDAGGRLLRHAYQADRLVAAELARRGWARALPVAPNLTEQAAIELAVAAARAANVGIWALDSASVALTVDKVREVVTVTNRGPAALDVSGWWLVSLRGEQGYRFPPGATIDPESAVRVVSGQSSGAHRFQQRNVWNNTSPDPAELRRPDGRVVAVWDDATVR
ncbi:MAG: thermonuclease family protein [Chloroflexi bacterium]|nr:thermonuclease family protein [Chloroflexota bacterium]